jgi:hypothetical protein
MAGHLGRPHTAVHAYLLAASRAEASELADTEPAGLAAQMQQAERATRRASPRRAPAARS